MIDCAQSLFKNKNFSATFQLVNGLTNPCLTRLQYFWEKIDGSDRKKKLERVKMTASDKQGYKIYRNSLSSVKNESCIPSLTVALKDLGGLELGSKTVSDGKINFDKIMAMHKVIEDFLKFKKFPYDKEFDIDNKKNNLQRSSTKSHLDRNKSRGSAISTGSILSLKKHSSASDSLGLSSTYEDEEEETSTANARAKLKRNEALMMELQVRVLSAKDHNTLFEMSKMQDMSADTATLAGSLLSSGFFV
jgi:hypothetical protein